MRLSIKSHLLYRTQPPCDVLIQIEALTDAVQTCRKTRLIFTPQTPHIETGGHDGIGIRRWAQTAERFECHYETEVEITRPDIDIATLATVPKSQIPGDAIQYLFPSRYCHSELFLDFVAQQFGALQGGTLVCAMNDWVNSSFTYDINASFAGATATDSFATLSGVCRDYAHMLISLVRAAGIPARFVSAYAPDVTPQDFHAVVEVFLDGAWHLMDPTGMSKASEIARIGVGRDAADVSFLTSYGWIELQEQSVEVRRVHL